MSEKKKIKKKGMDSRNPSQSEDKPTKLDYEVAGYMKKNVPTKNTKFLSHQVDYFNANKAVDILLDSKWATGNDILFTDRNSVVKFCNRLLQLKFFHRAKKITITDRDLRPKDLKKKKEKEAKQPSKKKEESDDAKLDEQSPNECEDMKEKDTKKKKNKVKLDMHLEQVFVDGPEAYVWMYDPVPFWYYFAGALLLVAAIAVCLFPLWPPIVRQGVYYSSIAAAGFLGVIFGLAILRFIIFIIIWTLSLGRHHFWILPNLTEDVGFFASFWPLYFYEYKGDIKSGSKSKKKRKRSSEDNSEQEKKSDGEPNDNLSAAETNDEKGGDNEVSPGESDSDNTNSQQFVMVDKDDITKDEENKE